MHLFTLRFQFRFFFKKVFVIEIAQNFKLGIDPNKIEDKQITLGRIL